MARSRKAKAKDDAASGSEAALITPPEPSIEEVSMSDEALDVVEEDVPAVPVVEFAGTTVRADALFVTPVDREVTLMYNSTPTPFDFKANVPRGLPAGVIREALGQGVQVAS